MICTVMKPGEREAVPGARGAKPEARSGLRGLLSEPPLIDRLRWREGVRPQTLISRDVGLMARVFGTLYSVGGILGMVMLGLGAEPEAGDLPLAMLSIASLLLGAVCFVVYDQLPSWFFQAMLTLGTLMVGAATAAASAGAEGIYALLFIWIVLLAFLFFPTRDAALQSLLAAAVYATVLFAGDAPFALSLLVVACATIGTTGAIIGLLVTRVERIASGFAAQAHTDPVTAIGNRRDFDERFTMEIERAERHGRPLSLVVCDLDRFKEINDELGHEEGDAALRRVAAAIVRAVRSIDAVTRLGGEEFGVILPDTNRERASQVAERIRTAIGSEFASDPVTLTASCGVACTDDAGGNQDDLFRAADGALYVAKREGRDRTVAFEPESLTRPGTS